jgi:phosphatidate cytidylyltransferase
MSVNLLKRIITSVGLLALLIIVIFTNKFIFIISILIIGLIICFESNNMFSKLTNSYSNKESLISEKTNFKFLILNILTFSYIFFVFCNFSYEIYRIYGPIFFVYLISICFFTDIGGYVVGKSIGGKKLTKISPNKTVSGTVGSFIFGITPLILFVNFNYINLELNLWNFTFTFLVSLISQLGDLLISFFKRKANIKDTGKILPGHGGVLDRLDGIIFALPFSYILLRFV